MSVRGIARYPTAKGVATVTNAPIYVDSDDNRVKMIPAGSGSTEVILQEAGGASTYERLTAARVLTAADSGKTFALALAGGFTVTLPALSTVSGFSCQFVVEIAPTTDYVISAATADLDKVAGQVYSSDGVDGDSETDFTADQLNFIGTSSVIGDSAEIQQVGTAGWLVKGFCNVSAGITITG